MDKRISLTLRGTKEEYLGFHRHSGIIVMVTRDCALEMSFNYMKLQVTEVKLYHKESLEARELLTMCEFGEFQR